MVLAQTSEAKLEAALLSQARCGNFVRHDDQNLYLGFGTYSYGLGKARDPRASIFRVVDLNTHAITDYRTEDAVVDVVTKETTAYVLTYSFIEEWDLRSQSRQGLYETHVYHKDLGRFEHAVAMAPYGDKLVIAHGRRGLSVFDTNTKVVSDALRLVEEYAPLESKVTGIAVYGQYAYVVLDSHHLVRPPQKQPFRGLIVVDLETLNVVNQLDGMDVGADALSVDKDFLVVSFAGQPIWKYSRLALHTTQTLPPPLEYIWSFPVKGHPTGKAFLGEDKYFTCYLVPPDKNSGSKLYQNVPMVLDRQQLKLGK